MTRLLEKLLPIAGPRLNSVKASFLPELEKQAGSFADQLLGLLYQKNGFYGFESSLHVFPTQSTRSEISLDRWNESVCWRSAYDGMADGCLFFAEDVFGGQFALKSGGVYQFDPETARQEFVASDLEGWAEALLSDYKVLTGYPLAHQWQARYGAIPAGKRLVPKLPFVLGGQFSLDNLYLLDAVKAMRLRGSIATQIRDLPDGSAIKLEIVE
jgi:hypothetical protein